MAQLGKNWADGVWADGVWASGVWSQEGSDTTPATFAFAPATGVEPSTLTESGGAVISGLTAEAAITVVNGEYSIDLGSWTSAPGTIEDGQSVRVRGTSSADWAGQEQVDLTIGGVTASFVIQTRFEFSNLDDTPRKGKRRKRKASQATRAILSLSKGPQITNELTGLYRELSEAPETRERAQEIVGAAAPDGAEQFQTMAAPKRTAEQVAGLPPIEQIRALTADNEIALRMLHRELMEQLEQQDEEVIAEILARLL